MADPTLDLPVASEMTSVSEAPKGVSASEAPAMSEWILAKDALAVLCSRGANPVAIKDMLADYLRDGLVTAKAEATWLSSDVNLAKAWKSFAENDDTQSDVIVPVSYWRHDKRAGQDRLRWRWPFNKFFYTTRLKPLRRRMFTGVQFSTSDLAQLQPEYFRAQKRRRGRPIEVETRDAVWMEVIRVALNGELNTTAYLSGTDLGVRLKEMLQLPSGKLRAGETQIREISHKVYKLLKPSPDE